MSEPTNDTAPPRKRRRPALSCEQCRRRKIKCDRAYPCGQCLQSKTSSCTYSPDTIRKPRHVLSSSAPPASTSLDLPDRSRDSPADIVTLDSSPRTSPNPVSSSEATAPSSWTSPSIVGQSGFEVTTTANTLQGIETVGNNSSELNTFFPTCESWNHTGKSTNGLRGTVSKTRLFGPSHWMHSYGVFDKVALLRTAEMDDRDSSFRHDLESSSIGRYIIQSTEKCKQLARTIKSVPYTQWLANPNFREAVPSKEIADIFVGLYFKNSESIYRILHIPSFQQEYNQYWQQPEAASPVFILKLLLVMSIGVVLYQGSDAHHYRNEGKKWVFAAQAWLSSPFEKSRLHTSAVQLQCLLLLARQDLALGGDLVWISAGSLLRTAIQMGYHRDPKILPKMSVLQAEIRRRLWATILEINLQSACESGMPLLISPDDFDTEWPANVDDIEISDAVTIPVTPRPFTTVTQTSIQIALLKSLPARFAVVKYANNISREPSYDDVLQVGAKLSKILKENSTFISKANQSRESATRVSQLQQNMFDLAIRRFLLLIHRPFAAKGLTDPHYYFSRKVAVDTAITILRYPCSPQPLNERMRDDYTQLKTISGGWFRNNMVHVSMVIFAELWAQLEEDTTCTEQSKASREPLKECLREVITLAANRIAEVDNNIKGNLFMSLVLAQINAMEDGEDPERRLLDAATKSADECYNLLAARFSTMDCSLQVQDSSADDLPGLGPGQDFGMDFTMQDWILDEDNNQDFWFKSGFVDGQWWHC